ncbi:hypothetical protein [Microbacterium sp.]|uniref:hypothetical protein n=1 Tax=Microbacterium sp. TaxID=51671 RepID=UPI0039E59818
MTTTTTYKWRRQEIELQFHNGPEWTTVYKLAGAAPDWVINHTRMRNAWTVTHAPSGMRIPTSGLLAEMKSLVVALVESPETAAPVALRELRQVPNGKPILSNLQKAELRAIRAVYEEWSKTR